jgi:IclR family acetate operon transcriptional repressor
VAEVTRTVERALAIMAAVGEQRALTLADCSRACDLAPSTALRLLRTLESSGFVRRGDDGLYRPGPRLLQLGAYVLSSESLIDVCRPAMEQLAATTGESTYLSVEGHGSTALYISIVDGTHSVRHSSWVGRTIPLTSSAAGQALRGELPKLGFITVEAGIESDVTAIAAPIRSADRIVAALSLVIPSYRVTDRLTTKYGRLLVAATADVSARLGRPQPPTAE